MPPRHAPRRRGRPAASLTGPGPATPSKDAATLDAAAAGTDPCPAAAGLGSGALSAGQPDEDAAPDAGVADFLREANAAMAEAHTLVEAALRRCLDAVSAGT